jgi:hypothetical protein
VCGSMVCAHTTARAVPPLPRCVVVYVRVFCEGFADAAAGGGSGCGPAAPRR